MKVPWVSYTVLPSTRQAAVDLLLSSVISHVRRRPKSSSKSSYGDSDYVVERLAYSTRAQLLMQREHAGGGAADGEHALAHLEVESVKCGHSPTEVPGIPGDVLDREVDGEHRRSLRRHLELACREDEVLGAVGGLEGTCDSEKRGIVTRTSPSPTASSALGSSGMCSPPVGNGRARRAPARSVEVRPPELVVYDEAVAVGGCSLRLRRHGFPRTDRDTSP
jgi:hypothetical protein